MLDVLQSKAHVEDSQRILKGQLIKRQKYTTYI